jgi:hypothetical protein
VRSKWIIENDYQANPELDKDFLLYNKQALAMMELKGRESEDTTILLEEFLTSAENQPKNLSEHVEQDFISTFKSGVSGLTISNIAEFFFEKDMRNVD